MTAREAVARRAPIDPRVCGVKGSAGPARVHWGNRQRGLWCGGRGWGKAG